MNLRARLTFGFVLVFLLMGLAAWAGYQGNRTPPEVVNGIERAREILAVGNHAETAMADALAAQRGFLLDGGELDLRGYAQAKKTFETRMAQVKALAMDDRRQLDRAVEVEALGERWFQEAGQGIDVRSGAAGASGARADVALFGELRGKLKALLETERERLDGYQRTESASIRLGDLAMFGGMGLALVLGIVVMRHTDRRVFQLVGGEPREVAAVIEQVARGNMEVEVKGGGGIAASVRMMVATFKDVTGQVNAIASGDYSANLAPRSDQDELGIALQAMHTALRTAHEENAALDWLKTGVARLNDVMSGDPNLDSLASKVITEISNYLGAQVAALYIADGGAEKPKLSLLGSYAYTRRKNLSNEFALGEGLVGQAALEKQQILVKNVPEDYVRVTSGLGERAPRFICVTPFIHEDRLKGVVEVGMLEIPGKPQLEYLQQAMRILAVAVESAQIRAQVAEALEVSQRLTEELQVQQEELRTTNEELEEQSQQLSKSEERLKVQQEELEVSNEELREKNDLLEQQKREVEQARTIVSVKAEELALASKYKSEFLANMSHELRTPLNSLLLLAQSLAQNKTGNLTEEQVESARVIHSSGDDLLNLINEILDLSKIEAGRMDLHLGPVPLVELADSLRASFGHMAQAKGLSLEVQVEADLPNEISSDRKRIEQILRNLMSNALKFTASGGITATFGRAAPGTALSNGGFVSGNYLAVAIKDTGIGIAPDKHKLIFEAFQQEDGGTSRRFGGTGLGLTISRELAGLLGGEIQLQSTPGQGSTFTLYLPIKAETGAKASPARPRQDPPAVPQTPASQPQTQIPAPEAIPDDRDHLAPTDTVILVIEDDPRFASILLGKCHEKGFKCLAAPTGEAGLELLSRHLPSAVILDLHLPGMDGLAVLDAIKENVQTRHVPVHVVSAVDRTGESLRKGAVGHAVKPIDTQRLEDVFRKLEWVSSERPKRLLVIEDDPLARRQTVELIGNDDVVVEEAETGAQALQALRDKHYDCMVLDLRLPDMDGKELLETLEREGVDLPPVIIHTASDLSSEREIGLREHADSIVIKDARSPERLFDEVSLFLHRIVSRMPEHQRKIISNLHDMDAVLRDKTVLIVDDDMRTMFAMSRLVSERGMNPLKAENGESALRLLDEHPNVALVLMDIMMPVLDGYEAIKRIREQPRFRKLPIIALTAKAMPEDRQKCLAVGASDYLTKPINTERLISMMRVWLYG